VIGGMGHFGDRLATLSVHAVSQDGRIEARASGPGGIDGSFAPGAYRSCREADLARQLGQVGALLWVKYRRAYLEILEDYLGELVDEGDDSSREREYWQRLAELTVTGVSAHDEITVHSRALVSWEFTIVPGTAQALSESEFLAEVRSGVVAALADYRAQVVLLTGDYFDLGLPRGHRAGTAADGWVNATKTKLTLVLRCGFVGRPRVSGDGCGGGCVAAGWSSRCRAGRV
jgi:hypothetical protein